MLKNWIKKTGNPANLPWFVLGSGIVGLALRAWLFGTRTEASGLLMQGHPAQPMLWVLTVIVLAVVLWFTRNLLEGAKYGFNFPASAPGAVGCLLGAVSFGVTSVTEWLAYSDTLTMIASILGLASAVALLFLAYNRWQGKSQSLLYHVLVCVCLMLRLVSQYRHWSADPQLMNYGFQLLATVCLMLSAYQNAAFDAGIGNRRLHSVFHLGAIYFCCVSLLGGQNVLFYLGCLVWMRTNMCNLTPMYKQEEA